MELISELRDSLNGHFKWNKARLTCFVQMLLALFTTRTVNLNKFAEAQTMQRLVNEFQHTHDEIAVLLGISRTQVTNLLHLLKLDARIQHWMKQGSLSEAHGKILAGLPLDKQYNFAYDAIKKDWSVCSLDEAVKIAEDKNTAQSSLRKTTSISPLEFQLTEHFGNAVKVTINKNEGGHFRIPFQNHEQMQRILEKLGFKG